MTRKRNRRIKGTLTPVIVGGAVIGAFYLFSKGGIHSKFEVGDKVWLGEDWGIVAEKKYEDWSWWYNMGTEDNPSWWKQAWIEAGSE